MRNPGEQGPEGEPVQRHRSALFDLRARTSLNAQLDVLHRDLRTRHPFIHRIAVALYDPAKRSLRTFLHSTEGKTPLAYYDSRLEDAPELERLLESGQSRVIQDLSVYDRGSHVHTVALRQDGYQASYTIPYFWNGRFEAFIFFNARTTGCFTPPVLRDLDLYGHLVGSLALSQITAFRTLLAALRTSIQMVHLKDPETGGHLERMAHFARLIAQDLARRGKRDFDDDYIEHLFLFAPLHDVGKIGIPDEILMKRARLSGAEFEIMKRHAAKGRQIVDALLANFDLEGLGYIELLRHVVESHHEKLDGSGYPHHLSRAEIPDAARIVAVADIFDALTSRRPYKEPSTNEEAFEDLRQLSLEKLDADCVEALVRNRDQVERIQAEFRS